MRSKVPIELQGKIFSARNTLQYTSIPLGTFMGGFLADKIFVPYMKSSTTLRSLWDILVGNSKGSGIALLCLVIAVLGVIGCGVFRKNEAMLSLDEE